MQQALLKQVKPRCAELGVEVRAVTLADMKPPAALAEQIRQREIARVELEKNVVKVDQFKAAQKLMAKEALQTQAKEKVEAETRLLQAKTKADQMREVELSRLKQELDNAQLQHGGGRKDRPLHAVIQDFAAAKWHRDFGGWEFAYRKCLVGSVRRSLHRVCLRLPWPNEENTAANENKGGAS